MLVQLTFDNFKIHNFLVPKIFLNIFHRNKHNDRRHFEFPGLVWLLVLLCVENIFIQMVSMFSKLVTGVLEDIGLVSLGLMMSVFVGINSYWFLYWERVLIWPPAIQC